MYSQARPLRGRSPVVSAFRKSVGTRSNLAAVRKVADELVNARGVDTAPFQTSRYEYAEFLGLPVIECEQGFDGMLTLWDTQFIIQVKCSVAPERRNFTVAHEIGHYLMLQQASRQYSLDGMLERDIDQEEETYADLFAANLLMPTEAFTASVNSLPVGIDSIRWLAKNYWVSAEAAARRIVDLNLWSCTLLLCSPVELFDGRRLAKVHRHFTSRQSIPPRISGGGMISWGIEPIHAAVRSSSPTCGEVLSQRLGRAFHLECIRCGVVGASRVLALLFPH